MNLAFSEASEFVLSDMLVLAVIIACSNTLYQIGKIFLRLPSDENG